MLAELVAAVQLEALRPLVDELLREGDTIADAGYYQLRCSTSSGSWDTYVVPAGVSTCRPLFFARPATHCSS